MQLALFSFLPLGLVVVVGAAGIQSNRKLKGWVATINRAGIT